ncbi:hypothetical protein R1sor_023494 [Riccia sorocarpa]|uniref:Uncharacterized protein n=1 Tax=Riccia sorocarpa TaxID=122646 RepID=A0ABD3GMT2_9MARC
MNDRKYHEHLDFFIEAKAGRFFRPKAGQRRTILLSSLRGLDEEFEAVQKYIFWKRKTPRAKKLTPKAILMTPKNTKKRPQKIPARSPSQTPLQKTRSKSKKDEKKSEKKKLKEKKPEEKKRTKEPPPESSQRTKEDTKTENLEARSKPDESLDPPPPGFPANIRKEVEELLHEEITKEKEKQTPSEPISLVKGASEDTKITKETSKTDEVTKKDFPSSPYYDIFKDVIQRKRT